MTEDPCGTPDLWRRGRRMFRIGDYHHAIDPEGCRKILYVESGGGMHYCLRTCDKDATYMSPEDYSSWWIYDSPIVKPEVPEELTWRAIQEKNALRRLMRLLPDLEKLVEKEAAPSGESVQ